MRAPWLQQVVSPAGHQNTAVNSLPLIQRAVALAGVDLPGTLPGVFVPGSVCGAFDICRAFPGVQIVAFRWLV